MSVFDRADRLEREITLLEQARTEEARERDRLRSEVDKWHRVAMEAGAITCGGGGHIYPLRDRVKRLEKGIQDYLDGNYGRHIPRKVDTCAHGLFGWESCENCIDAYFMALLAAKD
jgi:hypothetical protein